MAASWRERKKSELREALYGVALRLFREKGYGGVSVQEITEAAGVAKGTFFNHFPSKEHVVEEWYRRLTAEAIQAVKGREFPTAEEAVIGTAVAVASRGANDPGLVDAKALLLSTFAPLEDAERQQDDEVRDHLLRRIERGRTSGEWAEDVDAELLADTILAVLTGTARAWVAERHRFDLARTVADRTAFVCRAAKVRGA